MGIRQKLQDFIPIFRNITLFALMKIHVGTFQRGQPMVLLTKFIINTIITFTTSKMRLWYRVLVSQKQLQKIHIAIFSSSYQWSYTFPLVCCRMSEDVRWKRCEKDVKKSFGFLVDANRCCCFSWLPLDVFSLAFHKNLKGFYEIKWSQLERAALGHF